MNVERPAWLDDIGAKLASMAEDSKRRDEKLDAKIAEVSDRIKDYKIYLGLGAEEFDDKAVHKVRECGIGLIKRVDDTIEYATDWEVKAY